MRRPSSQENPLLAGNARHTARWAPKESAVVTNDHLRWRNTRKVLALTSVLDQTLNFSVDLDSYHNRVCS